MLTARRVLFHPDEVANEKYEYKENTGAHKVKVMLLGQTAFKARIRDIKNQIEYLTMNSEDLTTRLELALAGGISEEVHGRPFLSRPESALPTSSPIFKISLQYLRGSWVSNHLKKEMLKDLRLPLLQDTSNVEFGVVDPR